MTEVPPKPPWQAPTGMLPFSCGPSLGGPCAWEGIVMTVETSGQKTVLVIEDDPWTRTITTALLAGEGFAVVEAKNGGEGLNKARQDSPGGGLLDLARPPKAGLEGLGEV